MGFLYWLQDSAIGIWVAETLWAYPLFETLHTIGMAMLMGALGLINLRVLGYKPDLPVIGTCDLLPLAWIGFSVNLISGLALFTSDAVYFFLSTTFRIKIVLVLLGGINAAILGRRVFASAAASHGGYSPTPGMRLVAVTSLIFWLGAIIAGRLIAYTP